MARAKPWRRRLLVALGAVGLLLLAAFAGQRTALFPSGLTDGHQGSCASHPGCESLWTEHDQGRTEAWFLPGHGVDPSHPGPLVIFAHGNAELIDLWPAKLEHYRANGISVLLPEYRGYGRSDGSPSEAKVVADAVAFYDLAVVRPEVDATRVILHGRSLGGGVAARLSVERDAVALILQSTFTSVSTLAWDKWWAPSILVLDDFDVLSAVEAFSGPVLIAHGEQDTLIPLSHAQTLEAAHADARLLVLQGGHNDVPRSWPAFWGEVDRTLAAAGVL